MYFQETTVVFKYIRIYNSVLSNENFTEVINFKDF